MKTYIIPYIVPESASWWAGVDIFNTDSNSKVVEINIYNSEGALVNTFDRTLNSFESIVLTPDEIKKSLKSDGRAKMLIIGEEILVTPLQGCGGEGFGVMPVHVVDGVKKP